MLRQLERLVALRDVTPDYTYYGIASPWLQARFWARAGGRLCSQGRR